MSELEKAKLAALRSASRDDLKWDKDRLRKARLMARDMVEGQNGLNRDGYHRFGNNGAPTEAARDVKVLVSLVDDLSECLTHVMREGCRDSRFAEKYDRLMERLAR